MESTPSPDPRVNIRVVSSDKPDGITFKLKTTSTLKKLFDSVQQLFDVQPPAKAVLKFDGNNLTVDDTPEHLGLTDDDVIDLSVVEKEESPPTIDLRVVDQGGEEMLFRVKSATRLEKLMAAYCERMGCASDSVRFLFNGQRIQPHNTPKSLEMESKDVIDVVIAQVGGNSSAMKQ